MDRTAQELLQRVTKGVDDLGYSKYFLTVYVSVCYGHVSGFLNSVKNKYSSATFIHRMGLILS